MSVARMCDACGEQIEFFVSAEDVKIKRYYIRDINRGKFSLQVDAAWRDEGRLRQIESVDLCPACCIKVMRQA